MDTIAIHYQYFSMINMNTNIFTFHVKNKAKSITVEQHNTNICATTQSCEQSQEISDLKK